MQLHDLMPAPGSTKGRKRVGRGHGSGHGGRSGRGQDGQGSRAGGTKGPGFEGGQLPLYQRLPKLGGFVSHNRVEYAVVNVGRLEELFADGDVITPEVLAEKGAIKSATKLPVKILGDGELTKKLTIKVEKVTAGAKEKIENAGGTVE
ncbi:MAG: 50S ribosomal protein L15 [Coriobacteriia bacterium]|nr:50S ribosomal protein L15 [Coriobacteriia bacterium]